MATTIPVWPRAQDVRVDLAYEQLHQEMREDHLALSNCVGCGHELDHIELEHTLLGRTLVEVCVQGHRLPHTEDEW